VKLALAFGIILIALIGVSLFPVRQTENAPFASPAFQRLWSSELVSAARVVDLWGSDPLVWRVEPYFGTPNNRRTVQYFERGRMELQADSRSVTLGLLARELTTGRIDLGVNVFEEREPPDVAIDGGEADERVPTYLTLSRLIGESDEDRSGAGQQIVQWIDRTGEVDENMTPTVVRFGEYVPETGHNLPDVTVDLFERSEFGSRGWIDSFGYPISEPFWTYYRRGDTFQPSLVQVFERRILIYSPRMENENQFTVANTGRHYYRWRYGSELTAEPADKFEGASESDMTLPGDYRAYEYPVDTGTPIDVTLSPSGHLLVLTEQGQILRANGHDPHILSRGFSVWVEGIDEPRGIVTKGNLVLVSTASGVQAYRNQGGQGALEQSGGAEMPSDTSLANGTLDKVVTNTHGEVYSVVDNDTGAAALVALDSSSPAISLSDWVADVGAVVFSRDHLFVAGTSDDGRQKILQLSGAGDVSALQAANTVATFAAQTIVHALEFAGDTDWPATRSDSMLVAVEDEDGGSLYLLDVEQPDGTTELLEFSRGLSRPVAMVFGLDGSLYVADAGLGKIIRIVHGE
jgi:hypothetical protein